MLPAIADPTRFLFMFTSTRAAVDVFKIYGKKNLVWTFILKTYISIQYAANVGLFVYDMVVYLFDNFSWNGGLTHH